MLDYWRPCVETIPSYKRLFFSSQPWFPHPVSPLPLPCFVSRLLSSSSSPLAACTVLYSQVSCCTVWIFPWLGESKKKNRTSCMCLSLHESCHVIRCMYEVVCVRALVCSPRACVSVSVRLCFLCMFYVLHFQAVINSLTPHRPRGFALLVFASLCSHFCLKPALSYHPRSLFSPSLILSLALPASLSPCEVCDLCNFIPPVAWDISQSGSMNIDELIRSALSKGQTQRSPAPTAPPALPVQYTDMPTSRVLHPPVLSLPHPSLSLSLSLSGQGLR